MQHCTQIIDSTLEADKINRGWSLGSILTGGIPCVALLMYTTIWYNKDFRVWDGFLLCYTSVLMISCFFAVSKTFHTKLLMFSKSFCKCSY
jgi:hypothetical protein